VIFKRRACKYLTSAKIFANIFLKKLKKSKKRKKKKQTKKPKKQKKPYRRPATGLRSQWRFNF